MIVRCYCIVVYYSYLCCIKSNKPYYLHNCLSMDKILRLKELIGNVENWWVKVAKDNVLLLNYIVI